MLEYCFNQRAQYIEPSSHESTASLQIRTRMLCSRIFRHYAVISLALDFMNQDKIWKPRYEISAQCVHGRVYIKISILTLSGPGGGGRNPPPLRFFLHNSKTPGDIEKKLSDFNFTPLMDILHILAITIVVRCCHSNLLFPVCHVIFWVEKTKKVELFSR